MPKLEYEMSMYELPKLSFTSEKSIEGIKENKADW
jgi:hypothetical protein